VVPLPCLGTNGKSKYAAYETCKWKLPRATIANASGLYMLKLPVPFGVSLIKMHGNYPLACVCWMR